MGIFVSNFRYCVFAVQCGGGGVRTLDSLATRLPPSLSGRVGKRTVMLAAELVLLDVARLESNQNSMFFMYI
jgi:hypothetical protein